MKRSTFVVVLLLLCGTTAASQPWMGHGPWGSPSNTQRQQESARGDSGVLAQEWEPGRIWATDFSVEVQDALIFNVTNLTYTTDGGLPAVTATSPASTASFLTKATDIRNANVRIRYRPRAGEGQVLADSIHIIGVRHVDFTSHGMMAMDLWSTATLYARSFSQAVSGTASAEGVLKSSIGLDNAGTTQRYLELEVTEDLLKVRGWLEGDPIPDWQWRRRSRPAGGGIGIVDWTITADDPAFGPAGFQLILAGAFVSELVVTELVRATPNIIRNPQFTVQESAGGQRPVYWAPNRALEAGETLNVETVADWHGRERPALHIESDGSGSPGLCTDQSVFAKHGRSDIDGFTRRQPYPLSLLGPELEISIWSKGANIQNGDPSVLYDGAGLAAAFVIKYFAEDGTELGASEDLDANVHYTSLGPKRGGLGTWDWHRTRVRMQVVDWWRVAYVTFTIGLHDSESSGELWILDPEALVVG